MTSSGMSLMRMSVTAVCLLRYLTISPACNRHDPRMNSAARTHSRRWVDVLVSEVARRRASSLTKTVVRTRAAPTRRGEPHRDPVDISLMPVLRGWLPTPEHEVRDATRARHGLE